MLYSGNQIQKLNRGLTHVMTVIVHMGGVREEPLAVSWNTSELDWYDTLDLLHFQSLCSVNEKKLKHLKMLEIEQFLGISWLVEVPYTNYGQQWIQKNWKLPASNCKQFISNKKPCKYVFGWNLAKKSVLLTELISHHLKTCCYFKTFVRLELKSF